MRGSWVTTTNLQRARDDTFLLSLALESSDLISVQCLFFCICYADPTNFEGSIPQALAYARMLPPIPPRGTSTVISPLPGAQAHAIEGGTDLDSRRDTRLRLQRLSLDSYPLHHDDRCSFPYA